MSPSGPNPCPQRNWDWRAACNFMAGGAGSGLVVWSAVDGTRPLGMALGALAVASGLLAVWAEIGRPWRAMNVLLHARRSWMTREALVAPLLLAAALAAAAGRHEAAGWAAMAAIAFVYCQARILAAARGIPAWREPRIVPLLVATALAEGGGAWMLIESYRRVAPWWAWLAFALLVAARLLAWWSWRSRVRTAVPARVAIDRAGSRLQAAGLLALAAWWVVAMSPLADEGARLLQAAAGALVLASGLWFKFTLVTRAAWTQGFALPHLPVRGAPRRPGG